MKELIKQGAEPEPAQEDMFDKDKAQPPKFRFPLKNQMGLKETERAIFETRVVPIGDPEMTVEWYKDGDLLRAGETCNAFCQIHTTVIHVLNAYMCLYRTTFHV